MVGEIIHVPPMDRSGLSRPRCQKCEYPLEHECGKCGALICITKHCQPQHRCEQGGEMR
jgi:hypothetical protein